MEFLGDVGFPLFLKMLQNTSLRECELLISTPNFFAPMSQSSSTLELLVDKSSFHLEPASPTFEIGSVPNCSVGLALFFRVFPVFP